MFGNPENLVLLNRKTQNNRPFFENFEKKIFEMFGNPGNSVIPNGNHENSVLLNRKTKKKSGFFFEIL